MKQHQLVTGSWHSEETYLFIRKSQNIQEEFEPFKTRPIHYLKILRMTYPVPWHHVLSEWICQLQHSKNLKLLKKKHVYLHEKSNSRLKHFQMYVKKLRTVHFVSSWHVTG